MSAACQPHRHLRYRWTGRILGPSLRPRGPVVDKTEHKASLEALLTDRDAYKRDMIRTAILGVSGADTSGLW